MVRNEYILPKVTNDGAKAHPLYSYFLYLLLHSHHEKEANIYLLLVVFDVKKVVEFDNMRGGEWTPKLLL